MATCAACPHACRLAEGQLGRCHARRATRGEVRPEGFEGRGTREGFEGRVGREGADGCNRREGSGDQGGSEGSGVSEGREGAEGHGTRTGSRVPAGRGSRGGRNASEGCGSSEFSESPAASETPEIIGRITSLALDPIEKKPIARWNPGATVLSLGGYGCNMSCPFCQNASIAQVGADEVSWREMTPAEVVALARELAGRRCIGIAYTYNEPLVAWEFVRDTAELAHEEGLANVLVSNGMANGGVLDQVAPLIDAANIDLKCFTEEGYRSLGGDLPTVRRTIERLASEDACHLEVTTLVVPGLSDDEDQVDAMSAWLASLDERIVYHLTRFFPRHRMTDVAPTPLPTLHRLADVARRHLPTVLLGNV